MVEVVKISKEGILLEIKEVPDEYLDEPHLWNDSPKGKSSSADE
jgi:hypothetical protein